MEFTNELFDELYEFVETKQLKKLREILSELNPADAALFFDRLEEKNIPIVFRILPKDLAGETFSYMDPESQELLIRSFNDNELRQIINDMYLDDVVDVIEEMPANVVARILQTANQNTRQQLNELLKYPEDSAGSIMTVEYVSLNKNKTVAEAFQKIRREGIDKETVYTCYVTEKRKLIGTVSVKDLLLADEEESVGNIMVSNVPAVDAYEDKEEVAKAFSKYDVLALPVVDKDGRIVGIVTVDDAIDVIEEEATEDIEKIAAITPSDRPYLKSSAASLWLQRIPWLVLLMVSATFTGAIITSFEDALQAFPALIAFIPMLMGTGGNAGGQASVTVIRGLALEEIRMGDVFKVLWKEIRVSVMCGVVLAVLNFIKIIVVDNLIFGSGITTLENLTVSLTLVVVVFSAKVIGSTLPIGAKRIGLDPAVMASPLITTVVDAISLIVYFAIATQVLTI
ncbi:MAG: magnesium transporter [Ruminococcaceae bacterium]|nr:magnesium transporter [Oscillospiraceae bacterium]